VVTVIWWVLVIVPTNFISSSSPLLSSPLLSPSTRSSTLLLSKMADAEQLKAQANKAFSAKNYPEAIQLYSDAIALDPSNHVLFSNRAAAKSGNRDYQGALEDAEKVSAAIGFARLSS
jgi:tetratricopeptide (TPR) repeat protein